MSRFGFGFRFQLIGLCLAVVAGGVWWFYQVHMPVRTVPVIIYLVDTLRADRLGVYGYTTRATSPVIDALAAESVVFDQAYAPAPWTVPSVASLITSTFLCEHRVLSERNRLDPDHQTLAERLGRAGYFTLAIYENDYAGPLAGLDRGYRISELKDPKLVNPPTMGKRVEQVLEQVRNDRFYLYIHTMEPHNINWTPIEIINTFDFVPVDQRRDYSRAYAEYHKVMAPDWSAGQPLGMTDNRAAQHKALNVLEAMHESVDLLYDASVFWADTNLGDLIERLKRSGIWDKAMFIFLSDHGEEFGEHISWFHEQSVYEAVARVPLIVKFPGGRYGGTRIDAPASLVDIMPFILNYLGRADLCEGCRGTSFLPDVTGAVRTEVGGISVLSVRNDQKVYNWDLEKVRGHVNVAVRQGHWKGIWNDDVERFELYDVISDPDERADLSAENPGLAGRLQSHAQRWLEDCRKNAWQTGARGELDAETAERLRALGYVY